MDTYTDKEIIVYPYNGILVSNKNKWATTNNMNETYNYYAE